MYLLERRKEDILKEKERSVKVAWNVFSSDLTIRDSLMKSFASIKFDSLKYFEQHSIFERAKNESNLDLEYFEFKINNYLLANFPNEKALIKLYHKLNNDLSNYNAQTKEYNVYISGFPNFIVAKKFHYHKAKYFSIKYGGTNEDPILKSKKLPEWAKGVDTN
jgi:hypothetical protein